ncbi:MAG: threonine--tRNA ligase [Chloroflexi bacterium]|nr:threonine--tRNA ligase [Chloroflexota bacterium]
MSNPNAGQPGEGQAEAFVPYEETELYRIRHSAAHVMAQAVLELYPEAKLAIGPPSEHGCYYDFDLGTDENGNPRTFTPEDLEKIEQRMKEIIRADYPFEYRVVDAEEAKRLFANQPYKQELIEGLLKGEADEYGEEADDEAEVVISTYKHDTFEDLCRGPHVKSTGEIPVDGIKLMSVAGAYWRGDENNPMLQRIYGTAWPSKSALEQYLQMLEEARERDHRKLGRELEIFTFDEEVGPGLPLWLPNGAVIAEELENLAKEMERKHGYVRVRTPHLAKEDLFYHSGHLPYYAGSMYPPMEMEGTRYYVKPMNCPMHHKIFAARQRSYRELPLRLAEYGTCYRYEKSGELFGLMRVRSMQMNDAHIYTPVDLFEQEFLDVINMYLEYFQIFNIDRYMMRFSTHHRKGLGKKYVNKPELWQRTEQMVRDVLVKNNIPFVEVPDEAAFYGPKIDVQIWSATGREFTLATNQVDFAQPASFNLTFVNSEGEDEMPLVLHRAPLSTHERMIGFLIEHYAGNFPVWLAPEQVRVIPITDQHREYAVNIADRLFKAGVRAEADLGPDRMGNKIRQAQLKKVPYMLVVGDREMEAGTVSLRKRDGTQINAMPVDEFVALVTERIATRSPEL